MGTTRIIDTKIRQSQSFARLTFRQRDLWHGLICVADDQGRLPGTPMYVRSSVWPFDDISASEVEQDLQVLEKAGNIVRYEQDGFDYIQLVNWWKYQKSQWAGPSNFPPPPGWTDRMRYHGKGNQILTQSWDETGGFQASQQPRNQDSGQGSQLGSGLDSGEDSELHIDEESEGEPELPEEPKPKRKPSEKELKRQELERIFLMKTGLPAPRYGNKTEAREAQRLWWTPLTQILEMVDCDVNKASILVDAAVKKLRKDSLTISDPNSILKTARAEYAEYNGGGA